MKINITILFVLLLSFCAFGQKSVSELKPAHAIALENFLSKNKNYQFLSENVIGDEKLKEMRKDLVRWSSFSLHKTLLAPRLIVDC